MGLSGRRIVVGSRGSKLALAQAGQVVSALRAAHYDLDIRLEIVSTRGDQDQATPLGSMSEVGFFTRELEMALLQEKIDLAVHSLKDLPTEQPAGLLVGTAVPRREDVRDVIITHCGKRFCDLPAGARVGTGSLRRRAQLACWRGDVELQAIRGNIDTRLRKVREGQYEATVLALAGLKRAGLFDESMEVVSLQRLMPAPGQGALGLELREDDDELAEIIAAIDDAASRQAVTAERALLRHLEGGCHLPVAAFAELDPLSHALVLEGVIASPDGQRMVRHSLVGRRDAAAELGVELAEKLLDDGGREILDELAATE